MTEVEIAAAVTAKLAGTWYVGAQVEVLHSGKRGIIKSIREGVPGQYCWIRVQYAVSGHWEFSSDALRLL